MVPGAGIEPARCCHRGILSPLRLPISPPGHFYGWTYSISSILHLQSSALHCCLPQRHPGISMDGLTLFLLFYIFKAALCTAVYHNATRAFLWMDLLYFFYFTSSKQRSALQSTSTPPGHFYGWTYSISSILHLQSSALHCCLPQRHPGISMDGLTLFLLFYIFKAALCTAVYLNATRAFLWMDLLYFFYFTSSKQRSALLSTTTPPGHFYGWTYSISSILHLQSSALHCCLPQRHPGISMDGLTLFLLFYIFKAALCTAVYLNATRAFLWMDLLYFFYFTSSKQRSALLSTSTPPGHFYGWTYSISSILHLQSSALHCCLPQRLLQLGLNSNNTQLFKNALLLERSGFQASGLPRRFAPRKYGVG